MSVNMQVSLGGLLMKNPVTTASGTFASGKEYAQFFDVSRLGAITTKGLSLNGWAGNDTPRIAETPSGMLNSIGLQNPGVAAFVEKDLPWLREVDTQVIVNVSGHSVAEYQGVVEALETHEGVDAYEINISCPNVDCGGLTFGTDPEVAHEVVSACRAQTQKPLIVKLTPNVTDITEIARSVEDAGADAVSLINTLLGMAIDPYKRKPILARGVGGLSGPAVKPVALRMVWGTFASGKEYAQFFDVSRLGAITTKGLSLNGWAGNDTPRIAETPSGMLNSIGLQNPGVAAFVEKDLPWLREVDTQVIVNVSGHSVAEYQGVVEALETHEGVDAYEINISCPNVDCGGLTFGTDPEVAHEVVSACRAQTQKPLIVKLTPNVTDITEIARSVEDAGADAVSLINTLLGMAIDPYKRKPILARGVGGLSGPAVKPVALRMVWEVYKALDIPVLGMGGITCGLDAIEFMLAGASAVAVGTANFMNPQAALEVVSGIEAYCIEEGVNDVTELIGALNC